ncbi:hypothetical protein GCM10009558_016430 [Virgisporangium aurantiacum]
MFNRHTEEQDRPTGVGSTSTDRTVMVDRDHDGVDDRAERVDQRDTNGDGIVTPDEARAAHERTEARLANRERLAAEKADRSEPAENLASTTAVIDRPAVADRDRDGVDDRVQTRPTPAPQPKIRARASLFATLALIVGLTSVYAALSGRLAPVAVALGVLGLLLSFAGLSASGRPRVAGGGLSVFALLLSVGGAVLGVLAMTGTVTWLDSDVDQVSRLRDWLDAQFPFMSDW